ncbi:MAG: LysR family transcriptional regulator [Polaromonas sp.]|nr:LysR family transcriptional regulator [Polaromonas sp.]
METLANLESFARSAEAGSFSAAARQLALTPAAVSRNVAMLERNLGVRLFQRSTRKLTLTEAGAQFLHATGHHLAALQTAIADASTEQGQPSGVLKVSLAPSIGISHVLPLLPGFLQRYPHIQPDWHFENRPVDLIAEGFDAAIGGGFALSPGLVSRSLAPAHVVPVASPGYLAGRSLPHDPAGLAALDGIAMRSSRTGRARQWTLRDAAGNEMNAPLRETMVMNDPAALRQAALLGLGVALLVVADVLPWLERGELVRLVPQWYGDAGVISIYYPSRHLMPAKTRAFVDHVVDAFATQKLARRFAGSLG